MNLREITKAELIMVSGGDDSGNDVGLSDGSDLSGTAFDSGSTNNDRASRTSFVDAFQIILTEFEPGLAGEFGA